MTKPHFEFVSKKRNPRYAKDCFVYMKGSISEIRWYSPNCYYKTIEGTSWEFRKLEDAINTYKLFGY